jgi:CRP-like cAMP-binding protein
LVDVEVLFIPANTFSILIHDSPAIRSYLLGSFSREIISIKSRMKFMINSN